MNEQNIMENNEVLEVAEEITKSNSGLGWKIAGGVLVAVGAIYGGLKLRKAIKAKKEEDEEINEVTYDELMDEFEEKKSKKK